MTRSCGCVAISVLIVNAVIWSVTFGAAVDQVNPDSGKTTAELLALAQETQDGREAPPIGEPTRFAGSADDFDHTEAVNRIKRNAKDFRWPGGVMPYWIQESEFAPEEVRMIKDGAIKALNEQTNVKLRLYGTLEGIKTGCYGEIGNANFGRQDLVVTPMCLFEGKNGKAGGVLHQLIHSLGFLHESFRIDRNTYLSVNVSNIIDRDICSSKFWAYSGETYGQPHDFGSIMHLNATEFSMDKRYPSFNAKHPYSHCGFGRREGLSRTDIARINSMYPRSLDSLPAPVPMSCPAKLDGPPTTTEFPLTDPRNWNSCSPYFDTTKVPV